MLHRAFRREVDQPASFESLFAAIAGLLPAEHRYCEESLWSQSGLGALLPRLAEGLVGAPSTRSLILTTALGGPAPDRPAPDGAFAPQGQTFALCYGIWDGEADDALNRGWLDALVADCSTLTTGRYVAETDIATNTVRATSCFTPGAQQRLDQVRRRRDPDGIFHTWSKAPPTLESGPHRAVCGERR